MDSTGQPSHSPLLSALLLVAGAAFWSGLTIMARSGSSTFRLIVRTMLMLSLACPALVHVDAGRRASEIVLWALLGTELAFALLTVFSLVIFGGIPVVLTVLAIRWWPRRPGERAITPARIAMQFIAFLAALAPFLLPAT